MKSTKNFPENALSKAYKMPNFCYNCDKNMVSFLPLQSSGVAYCNIQSRISRVMVQKKKVVL